MEREEIKKTLKEMKIKEIKKLLVSLILKQQTNIQGKKIKELTDKQIFKRDFNQCVLCGDKEDLQIHHFKPKYLRKKGDNSLRAVFCKYCHWYLHANPKSDLNHSLLIKNSILKIDGKTFSYKGNRWGRKELKLDWKIITLYKQGKKYREICKEVYYWDKNNYKKFVSLGYVGKVLKNFNSQKIF